MNRSTFAHSAYCSLKQEKYDYNNISWVFSRLKGKLGIVSTFFKCSCCSYITARGLRSLRGSFSKGPNAVNSVLLRWNNLKVLRNIKKLYLAYVIGVNAYKLQIATRSLLSHISSHVHERLKSINFFFHGWRKWSIT